MDSPLRKLYADLYQEAENMLINSPPSMSLKPKALRQVGPDGAEDAFGHSSNELHGCNGSQINVCSANSIELNQTEHNSVRLEPQLSSPFDELLSLDIDWLSKALIPELEAAPLVASEAPSAANSACNHEAASVRQPQEPVHDQDILKKINRLQEVALRVAAEREKTAAVKEYPRPALSYPCLAALALKNSPDGELPVTGIYEFLCQHFPNYNKPPSDWKKSLRHALTFNKCFQKIETKTNGCVNERRSRWSIKDAKAIEMDNTLWKKTLALAEGVCKAMPYPQNVSALVCGSMQFVSILEGKKNGFMSERLHVADKSKEIEGEEEPSFVYYPPAKRSKIDATAKE